MAEFDLIARYFAPLASDPAARGLLDDAAVLPSPPPGHDLVITKDMIAADVHFFASDPADFIAEWLLAVNLSDLAAMGADPLSCVLGLGLPQGYTQSWVADFARGLGQGCRTYACPLLGGDTVSGLEKPVLSLTAFGTVPQGQALSRAGARPGDLLVVSGTIGAAGWQLANRVNQNRSEEPERHFLSPTNEPARGVPPVPRLALGRALRGLATACADVSDGLLADAGHLGRASGLAVEVDLAAVPVSGGWPDTDAARLQAVTSGDDYELVFALPAAEQPRLLSLQQQLGLKLSVIGRFAAGEGVSVRLSDGSSITPAKLGYEHG